MPLWHLHRAIKRRRWRTLRYHQSQLVSRVEQNLSAAQAAGSRIKKALRFIPCPLHKTEAMKHGFWFCVKRSTTSQFFSYFSWPEKANMQTWYLIFSEPLLVVVAFWLCCRRRKNRLFGDYQCKWSDELHQKENVERYRWTNEQTHFWPVKMCSAL